MNTPAIARYPRRPHRVSVRSYARGSRTGHRVVAANPPFRIAAIAWSRSAAAPEAEAR